MLFQAQAQPAAREWNTEIESELFRILRQLVSQCDFMAVESNKKNWLVFVFFKILSPHPPVWLALIIKISTTFAKSKGGKIAKHKSSPHLR